LEKENSVLREQNSLLMTQLINSNKKNKDVMPIMSVLELQRERINLLES
jgi:hypothetical protein